LNLLTPEHIKAVVASEQKHGLVSSLNWDITLPKHPGFDRQACEYNIITLPEVFVNDDILHMNTQSGSQIDGFRHVAHQAGKIFYNNLKYEEIIGPEKNTRCGMQACSKHGIVGRGVLLDFARWAEEKGIEYDPFTTYGISLDQIKDIATWEGVDFKPGDILLIRSGWMLKYNTCLALGLENELEKVSVVHPHAIGVDQSEEIKVWLHDQYFALVGGDQATFEAWPPRTTPILHEYLLACWGVMIGEMLDLEDLSAKCSQTGKYSFLFMSAPLNSPGGVATLANALCII
jgi:kynurenine formamidase